MLTLNKATSRQTWAIFCMTGWDVRNCNLSCDDASKLIGDLKAGKEFDPKLYEGIRQVKKVKTETVDYKAIYDEAMNAGIEAGKNAIPTPMIVSEGIVGGKQWYVDEGACGFAWVVVSPATQPFARWLKKNGIVEGKSYGGGYSIWCSLFNQSITRKEAWASAFAKVLGKYNIKCYSSSRLD
jgi:hypothetical protein